MKHKLLISNIGLKLIVLKNFYKYRNIKFYINFTKLNLKQKYFLTFSATPVKKICYNIGQSTYTCLAPPSLSARHVLVGVVLQS